VDLQTASEHCGACGHACVIGSCAEGRCQPVALATNQGNPSYVLVHDGYVYWAEDTGVRRVSVDGGDPSTLFGTTDVGAVGGLAKKGNTLYATDSGSGKIWEVPLDTLTATSLNLAGSQTPRGITTTADGIYWADSRTAGSIQRADAGVYGAFSDTQIFADRVTSAQRYVYFTALTAAGGPMALRRRHPDLSATVALCVGQTIADVTTYGQHVYWTVPSPAEDAGIYRNHLEGNTASVELVHLDPSTPNGLALDDEGVYWTTAVDDGGVMFLPHGATTPRALAERQRLPAFIAVDDDSVYWTDRDAGTVMRVSK
jgi:hypothetical protein